MNCTKDHIYMGAIVKMIAWVPRGSFKKAVLLFINNIEIFFDLNFMKDICYWGFFQKDI